MQSDYGDNLKITVGVSYRFQYNFDKNIKNCYNIITL